MRAFLDEPVPEAVVREIVERSTRAASGGNLQPWRLTVLTGDALASLLARVAEKAKSKPFGDGPEYPIYPPELTSPYVERRSAVAHEMYALVGIARDDKQARARQMFKNFEFFGAPVGMVLSVHQQMGPPQWADLGIFLQSMMLLAREHGLHTCPQEAWSMWGKTIREETDIPDDEIVFCGMALGYGDPDAPINELRTERGGLEEFASFRGF